VSGNIECVGIKGENANIGDFSRGEQQRTENALLTVFTRGKRPGNFLAGG